MILKTFLIVFMFGLIFYSRAQSHSCCSTNDKGESFASFSNDKGFRDIHLNPKDYKLQNAKGEMITFKTKDGKSANAYFVKSPQKSDKYVFVFHEWWGLNDYIKKEADKLKKDLGNVNVLAIDLYDGKVAANGEDASKYMQAVKPERAMDIISGAIKYVGKDAKVGTLGWCFGGGWSLQASIMLGKQGKACVMYYGIIENTPETFKDLNAPVLGIFAEKDGWVNPKVVSNLESNIKAAGKNITVKSFDANHAFANPSNPKYDKKATAEAKELTIKFFKEHLIK